MNERGGGGLHLLLRVAEHLRTTDDDGSCPVQGNNDNDNNANANNKNDMRVSPTLPPLSAVAALRSFEPLDDLMARFSAFREQTQRCMRSCAKIGRVQVPDMGMSGHDNGAALVPGFSFAQCMVQVSNPTFALLQPDDAKRCVASFVEKAAALVSGRRQELLDALGQYNTKATAADAFESLRDPVHAVSDAGLNDAVLLHMSKLLRVCIVVSARSYNGSEQDAAAAATYRVFPPAVASDAEPTVLVSQGQARYEVVQSAGVTLRDVQRHLAATGPVVLLPSTGLERKTRKELAAMAERLAVPLLEAAPRVCGTGRATARARTKGELLAALLGVAAL